MHTTPQKWLFQTPSEILVHGGCILNGMAPSKKKSRAHWGTLRLNGLNNMLLINLQKLRNNMFLNIINIFIIIIYSKCQSSIFLFADWTKLYHVPVHKTSCSLHVLVRDNWSTMKQLLTVVNNKTRSKAQAFRTNRKVQSSYKSFSIATACRSRSYVFPALAK